MMKFPTNYMARLGGRLIENGYLVLKEPVRELTPIAKTAIDWGRTMAWGDGGYYGRLFLNVAGREPEGTVAP